MEQPAVAVGTARAGAVGLLIVLAAIALGCGARSAAVGVDQAARRAESPSSPASEYGIDLDAAKRDRSRDASSEPGLTAEPIGVSMTFVDDASASNGVRIEITVKNNTGDGLDLAHVIQVLDFEGHDVITALAGDVETVTTNGTGILHEHEAPPLADGYYHVLATAAADPTKNTATGSAQAFIRVVDGKADVITFAEWWLSCPLISQRIPYASLNTA